MTLENPGAFADFYAAHPEIPETEKLSTYCGQLALFKAALHPNEHGGTSPDFILLQRETEQRGVTST